MNKLNTSKRTQSFEQKKKTVTKKKRHYKHILDSDIQENLNEKITKRLDSIQIVIAL